MHDPTSTAEQDLHDPSPAVRASILDRALRPRLSFRLTIGHTRWERTTAKTIIAESIRWRIGQLDDIGLATCPIFHPVSGSLAHFLPAYSPYPNHSWGFSGAIPPSRTRFTKRL